MLELKIITFTYNYIAMIDKGLSPFELDSLINRLVSEKKGNDVKMSEGEIKAVCMSARDIFLSQPMLLEL
jgi:serine/threonine-protein phosphatase PP1 catalytic subunit